MLRACNLGSLSLLQWTSVINFFVGGARHEYPNCHRTWNLYMQSGIYYTCLFEPLQAQCIRKRPSVSLLSLSHFSYFTFSLVTYRLLYFTPVLHSPPLPFPCPFRHRLAFPLLFILLFSCSLILPSPSPISFSLILFLLQLLWLIRSFFSPHSPLPSTSLLFSSSLCLLDFSYSFFFSFSFILLLVYFFSSPLPFSLSYPTQFLTSVY